MKITFTIKVKTELAYSQQNRKPTGDATGIRGPTQGYPGSHRQHHGIGKACCPWGVCQDQPRPLGPALPTPRSSAAPSGQQWNPFTMSLAHKTLFKEPGPEMLLKTGGNQCQACPAHGAPQPWPRSAWRKLTDKEGEGETGRQRGSRPHPGSFGRGEWGRCPARSRRAGSSDHRDKQMAL